VTVQPHWVRRVAPSISHLATAARARIAAGHPPLRNKPGDAGSAISPARREAGYPTIPSHGVKKRGARAAWANRA
jgi:hypothetical protein